jgi:hypothetical protein
MSRRYGFDSRPCCHAFIAENLAERAGDQQRRNQLGGKEMNREWIDENGEVCRLESLKMMLFFMAVCLLGALAMSLFVIRVLIWMGFSGGGL